MYLTLQHAPTSTLVVDRSNMHLKTSVITLVVSVIAITLISSVVLLRDLDTIDDGGSVRWNITRVNGPLIMSKPILINAYNPFYWEDWVCVLVCVLSCVRKDHHHPLYTMNHAPYAAYTTQVERH